MARCGHCNHENAADARLCEHCGAQVPAPIPPSPIPPRTFGEEIGEAGRRMGEAFGQMGKTSGEGAGRTGNRFEAWWDQTLGFAAPLVSGFIGVVVLLCAIVMMGVIAAFSEDENFGNDLVSFVERNLWLFVGLIFLNSFSSYFHRRYRKTWRWIMPVPMAVGSLGWFWIFAQVLEIAQTDLGHPRLGDLANIIELMLPLIFVLVLVIGYLMVFWITIGERGDEPPRYGRYGRIR